MPDLNARAKLQYTQSQYCIMLRPDNKLTFLIHRNR